MKKLLLCEGWKFKQVLFGVLAGFVVTGGIGLLLLVGIMEGVRR